MYAAESDGCNAALRYGEARAEVARFMRRLYRQGLTTTSGGNLSCRTSDGRVLLTASKFDKGTLQAGQVGILSPDGTNETPALPPSIESSMHIGLYRALPEIGAVVHAHPPVGSAFCAAGRPIDCRLLAESYAILGEPVLAPYARMGTEELAGNVVAAARRGTCVLMENHGVLTVGVTLLEAFDRLEVLEAAAKITLFTGLLGGGRVLSEDRLSALDALMGRPPPG